MSGPKVPRKALSEVERVQLFAEIKGLVLRLVDASSSEEAENGRHVVEYVMGAIAGFPGYDDALVHRLWRALMGGRPDHDDDDAVRARICGDILSAWHWTGTLDGHDRVGGLGANPDMTPAQLVHTLRGMLAQQDEAFGKLTDEDVLKAHQDRVADRSVSGVLTDLARAVGALGVRPRGEVDEDDVVAKQADLAERNKVQKRFDEAMRRRPTRP
jgi:hypothetical protein